MSGDRYTNLAPGSVAAALRSFGRRYRGAVTSDPGREPDELADRKTRDGRPVRDAIAETIATLEEIAPALNRVIVSNEPSIPDSAAGGPPAQSLTASGRVVDLTERLDTAATRVAELLDRAPPADLMRTGTTTTGKRVTAIDLGRQAVRVAAENLMTIERAIGGRDNGDDDE